MEPIYLRLIAIAIALPVVVIAGMALLRLLQDLSAGTLRLPRWGALGGAFAGMVAAICFIFVREYTAMLLRAAPDLEATAASYLPLYAAEIGIGITLMAGWLLDTAERRQRRLAAANLAQQERLKATERSFSLIVESAPEAVIIVAPAGARILAANAFARSWLGRDGEDLEATTLGDWLGGADADDPGALLARLTDSGTRVFVNFQHGSGAELEAEVAGSSVVFLGRPAVVLMARDVSAVEQARRAAEATSRAKNAFLTHVSHEIRTPLGGILGSAELALDAELPVEIEEDVRTIHRCARDLLFVIDDVLDFSRLEAGQLELRPRRFDPAELASSVVQHLASRARARALTLVDVPRRDLPKALVGDAGRIRQVLFNLVGNALKYTSAGEVELRVQPVGRTKDGRRTIRFVVRDTGPGIAPERIDDLFDAACSQDDRPEESGTGLGLALSRQLSEALGGSLEVESTLGRGSLFTLEVELGVDEESDARESSPLTGRRALVVHPSSAARSSLVEKLLAFGVSTRAVGDLVSGISALEDAHLTSCAVDVLFIDVALARPAEASPALERFEEQLGAETPRLLIVQQELARIPRGYRGAICLPTQGSLLHEELCQLLGADPGLEREPGDAAEDARILVVEDNPVNQRLVVALLEKEGYAVDAASHGEEALARIEGRHYALVLMDVQMPVVDGLEATRRLRRDPRFEKLPVVALTAHAMSQDREDCIEAGMNEYLTKPVRREDLLAIVRRHLPERVMATHSE